MALQQSVKTVLQRRHIQLAAQTQGGRDVVRGALRVELPQKPLPLLGIGQRARCVWRCGLRDRQLAETDALLLHLVQELSALLRCKAGEAVGNTPGGRVFHQLISISSSSDSSALRRTSLSAGVWACTRAA